MHSKIKGTLAETKVIADLYSKNFSVAIPVDDLMPFDLICIDNEFNTYKIQVKYCTIKHGAVILYLRNSMSNKTLKYTKIYSKKEVDVFAIYVLDLDKCIYISSNILEDHIGAFNIHIGKTKKQPSKKY